MTQAAHYTREGVEPEPRMRGRGRDVRERLQEAEAAVAKYHAASIRHRTRAARAPTSGKQAEAERLAVRSESLRRRWAAEVAKLHPKVKRANRADRIAANCSTMLEASRAPQPSALELRERERQARAQREIRRRYGEAGVLYDPRTAASAREFIVETLGATARARVARYEALFSRPADATTERVQAVQSFDMLCHSAHKGLYPLAKFESSGTGGLPRDGVPGNVLAREEMSRLARHVGDDGFALMWVRVILRVPFGEMERRGLGDRRYLNAHFLVAVDSCGRFFRLKSQSDLAVRLARLFGGGMLVGTLCPAG